MIFIIQQKKRIICQIFNQERERAIQLQNEIYILKKQLVNKKDFNVLINLFKNFTESSFLKTTLVFNNINIIIKSKRFVKHVDFKVFIDDFEKKTN